MCKKKVSKIVKLLIKQGSKKIKPPGKKEKKIFDLKKKLTNY